MNAFPLRICIRKHSTINVDGKESWVSEGDTYTRVGDIFQDDESIFTFHISELPKIDYYII